MNILKGLLLDNLGLKLVALLLALAVYFNVFTERPAMMVVSFPIEYSDLPDSLSLSGPTPPAVKAEVRGTGKQFIRLWLTEPRLKISLAGEKSNRSGVETWYLGKSWCQAMPAATVAVRARSRSFPF